MVGALHPGTSTLIRPSTLRQSRVSVVDVKLSGSQKRGLDLSVCELPPLETLDPHVVSFRTQRELQALCPAPHVTKLNETARKNRQIIMVTVSEQNVTDKQTDCSIKLGET